MLFFTETCISLWVPNGNVECNTDPTTVGLACDVVCDDGYTPDQDTVTCQTGDIWSATPTCLGA